MTTYEEVQQRIRAERRTWLVTGVAAGAARILGVRSTICLAGRNTSHASRVGAGAAAPSPIPEALPAVTTPSARKYGFSLASASAVVSGRGEQLPRLGDPLSVINGQVRPPATYLDAEEILRQLKESLGGMAEEYCFTQSNSPRAVPAAELARRTRASRVTAVGVRLENRAPEQHPDRLAPDDVAELLRVSHPSAPFVLPAPAALVVVPAGLRRDQVRRTLPPDGMSVVISLRIRYSKRASRHGIFCGGPPRRRSSTRVPVGSPQRQMSSQDSKSQVSRNASAAPAPAIANVDFVIDIAACWPASRSPRTARRTRSSRRCRSRPGDRARTNCSRWSMSCSGGGSLRFATRACVATACSSRQS